MRSTADILVRPVRKEDFDDLRATYFQLYDERDSGESIGITLFATRPTVDDEAVWFDRMMHRVLEGDEIFLVAEVDGHVVGSCSIDRVGAGPSSEQAHVGELGILVRKGTRGKGVGTTLLERSLAEARSRFELVYLTVFSQNQGAQRLYRRFGFSVCGHLPRVVKRGGQYFDEERMVLDFGTSKDPVKVHRGEARS